MSEEGNRLTAPPIVMRRGTRSSSKSTPRSTSSQPTRRAAVPPPDVRIRSYLVATAGSDLLDGTDRDLVLDAGLRREMAPNGWARGPGSGGVPLPGGTRRTRCSRERGPPGMCQVATAERAVVPIAGEDRREEFGGVGSSAAEQDETERR